MDTHGDATAVAHATDTGHGHEEHSAVDHSMRFEKSELHEFVEADRSAGEHVGILLAVVFCISLFLMIGVTYWTSHNQGQGHDPHTIVGVDDGAHH